MQKQPFRVGGGVGSKKFEDWGVKDFRTGGLPIWGGATFDWGRVSTPLHAMIFFQISHSCVTECTLQKKIC